MSSRKLSAPFFALAALLAIAAPAPAQEALTPAQEDAVRALVRDYILKNPEIITEAVKLLQERERSQTAEIQRQALTALRSDLINDPAAPTLGNPKGDVTIVEFFDYRCGYCKQVAPAIAKLLEEDKNLRLVVKEFPILGPESVVASQAALASMRQNKYAPFHWALLNSKGQLDEAQIMRIAGQVGLDTKRLREDMNSSEVEAAIKRSYKLAEALQIRGTPAFVIGDELVPGAVDVDDLRRLVAKARKG